MVPCLIIGQLLFILLKYYSVVARQLPHGKLFYLEPYNIRVNKFNSQPFDGSISVKLHRFDVVTSVLGHIIFWRVARITTYIYPHGGSGGILIVTIIVFAVLFWTATKVTVSGNKLRESNTNPNVFPDTKIPILRANFGAKCECNFLMT